MTDVRLSIDTNSLAERLTVARKSIRGTVAAALTTAAKQTSEQMKQYTQKKVQGGATAYTLRGITYQSANKNDSEIAAWVFVRKDQAEYLKLMEKGGTDTPDQGYKSLTRPGDSSKDSRGNMQTKVRNDMRSMLQAYALNGATQQAVEAWVATENRRREIERNVNRKVSFKSKKNKDGTYSVQTVLKSRGKAAESRIGLFVGKPRNWNDDKAKFGLWRRQGKSLKLLVAFDKKRVYKPSFRFEETAEQYLADNGSKIVQDRINDIIERALNR